MLLTLGSWDWVWVCVRSRCGMDVYRVDVTVFYNIRHHIALGLGRDGELHPTLLGIWTPITGHPWEKGQSNSYQTSIPITQPCLYFMTLLELTVESHDLMRQSQSSRSFSCSGTFSQAWHTYHESVAQDQDPAVPDGHLAARGRRVQGSPLRMGHLPCLFRYQ